MNSALLLNIMEVTLFSITLFVSLRSFYIYAQIRNPRLFILGLSMGMIALSGAAEFISDHITIISVNTDWFEFITQACSLLFILLSLLRNSEEYFQRLMHVQVVLSASLVGVLLLSGTLPPFPSNYAQAIISGPRFLFSFAIFYCYISAFMTKPTRFSLLMSTSFALIGFGYLMAIQQYFLPGQDTLSSIGYILRFLGLVALLAAVLE